MRIAQLTDCHLQADENTLYKGVNADTHLDQCIASLAQQEDVDLLLLSGDLSHFGSADAYERLRQKVDAMGIQAIWLLGNHDDGPAMEAASGQAVEELRCFDFGPWMLIALNTTHSPDGCGGGSLSQVCLEQLEQALIKHSEQSVCIVMHHNAVPVHSKWQDDIMLANAWAFNELVAAHAHVKVILCGHVHQEYDQNIGAARYIATPSTAVQFTCEQNTFQIEADLGPAYRMLTLDESGGFHTQVTRLPKVAAKPPVYFYLHGFNSSPASHKAQEFLQLMAQLQPDAQVIIPELSPWPAQAMQQIERLVQEVMTQDDRPIAFLGSSLGGYYATYMAQKYKAPAVLINPATEPYVTLATMLGKQENYYTQEVYELTHEHIKQLLDLQVQNLTIAPRMLVLLQTDDEVLDYRLAEQRYLGAEVDVEQGGDHGYQNFAQRVPQIMAFIAKHA